MKKDLIMGWLCIAVCFLMLFCVFYNIFVGNAVALPFCIVAFFLNLGNAVGRFKDYKRRKELEESIRKFQESFDICWPDHKNDEPEEDNRITD